MRPPWRGVLAALLAALPLARAADESCKAENPQASKGLGLLQVHSAQNTHSATPLVDAGERASGKPTFAVFTRIIKEELPYVRSFVDHYTRLGVTRFYMLSNKEGDLQKIRAYLDRGPKIQASFKFVFRRGGADEILKPNKLLELVAEDYVITVDLDEYWVLPSGVKSLHDLVAASLVDIFYTNWRMVTYDDATGGPTPPPYASYAGIRGKYMAKRSVLRNFHGIHVPNTVPGNHTVQEDVGALVHFWSRSLADVVAKGAAQVFNNCTGGNASTIAKMAAGTPAFHACGEGAAASRTVLERGGMSQRMKVLALMAQHPTPELVHADHELLRVDKHEESQMLQEVFESSLDQSMKSMKSVRANYLRYKACVQERVKSNYTVLDLSPNQAELWLETVDCPDGNAADLSTKG